MTPPKSAALEGLSEPLLSPNNSSEFIDPLESQNDSLNPAENPPQTTQVYLSRWLVLFLLSFSSLTSAMLWITFAVIANHVEQLYKISSTQVNYLSVVFIAAYLPMSIVSSVIYQKYGVRKGMLVSVLLNGLGGILRYLSVLNSLSYALLFGGQLLAALAQPFLTNLPAKLASLWFPPQERDLSVAIGSLSNAIGIMVGGSVLPVLYSSKEEGVDIPGLLLLECWWTIVNFLLVLVLFQEKPPLAPSLSQTTRDNTSTTDVSLKHELYSLLHNRDFCILTISFGVLGLAIFNTLLTVMEQLITPAGYSSDDASWFLLCLIVCGIIGALVVGIVLDYTHCYNLLLKLHFVSSFVSFNLMLLSLRPNNHTLLSFCFCWMGWSMMPLLPISLECACETTFPDVSEDVSSGVLQSANQLSAPIFIMIVSSLLSKQEPYSGHYKMEPAYVVFSVASILFVVGILFYHGDYKRLEAERRGRQSHDEAQVEDGQEPLVDTANGDEEERS